MRRSFLGLAFGALAIAGTLLACSSHTEVVNHAFGIECRVVAGDGGDSAGGCVCFLSATPNDVVCDAETVAGTCKKTSEWPRPKSSGYSYYSADTYSSTSPGCQCLPTPAKGPPTTAKISCTGQDSSGKIGKDDSCYCSKLAVGSTSTEEPCSIAAGQTGICCATADRCDCSTYSFDQKCDANQTKVTSCTGAVFPKDPAPEPYPPTFTVGGYSSYSSVVPTESCVTTPFDRSQVR